MIEHPVFARPMGDKVVLMTIVDRASLPFVNDDCIILARTQTSVYTGNHPTITLNKDIVLDSKEYIKTMDSQGDIPIISKDTHGLSFNDVLLSPLWFIRKVKSIFEMFS